jgi:hypothetical protein
VSDRIFVGTHKGVFTVDRTPSGWKLSDDVSFLGDPMVQVLSEPGTGRVWAALDLGHFGQKLHRSTDGGKTWGEIAVPEYPPKPEGLEEKDFFGREIEWKLSKIWALATGGADRPNVIWCGTLPGGLFRSEDGGDSWEMVRSLWDHPDRKRWMGGGADWPGIHSICVDPRDSRRVSVGVSTGGVWVTDDEGKTWNVKSHGMRAEYVPPEQAYDPISQDAHLIVQCPAAPDVFWCQHHNGIFRSTDNSETWHEIKQAGPSTFGFAVAVHPKDPGTAWFVPAMKDQYRVPVDGKLVVTRTRDGAQTFDVLSKGLPEEKAYDLVFRHGLDVDDSGDRLAFGSTTGGLWVSEDQGDSWQCVSAHLPPVNAVRFMR